MVANRTLYLPGRWLALCAALALICSGAPTRAQAPANDEKEGAIDISLPGNYSQSTWEATSNPTDPEDCRLDLSNGATVWFRLTPNEDTWVLIDTCGSDYDTILGVWESDGAGNVGACLACDDDSDCSYYYAASDVKVPVKAGMTYYIVVAAYYYTGGWLVLNASTTEPPPVPPVNDEYTGAIPIESLPFAYGVETNNATASYLDKAAYCFWFREDNTVWFKLTASEDRLLRVATDGTDYNYRPVLSVWQPDSEGVPSVEVGCSDSFPIEGFGNRSQVDFWTVAGETYYIRAGHSLYYGGPGWLHLLVDEVGSVPDNDTIEGAIEITQPEFSHELNTNGASRTWDEPYFHWFNNPNYPWWVGYTVWYKITPSERLIVAADTLGSNYNTTLSVFRQVEWGLEHILGDDDAYPMSSALEFTAEAGQSYYMMVGARGTTGRLVFHATAQPNPLTLIPPAPTTMEVAANRGQPIPLTAAVTNAAGHETALTWYIDGERIEQILPAGPAPTTHTVTISRSFPVGNHPVILIARDGTISERASSTINITDTEPPVVDLNLTKVLYPADLTLKYVGKPIAQEFDTWRRVVGLPSEGRLASTADLGTYQLAPYASPNAVVIEKNVPEVTINVPPGVYERFGMLCASTPWSADLDVIIRYGDGSEDVLPRGLHAPDWREPYAQAPIVVGPMDRTEGSWSDWVNPNLVHLFESVISPRTDQAVVSLTFRRIPENVAFYWTNRTYVMALNGRTALAAGSIDISGQMSTDVVTAKSEMGSYAETFFSYEEPSSYVEAHTKSSPVDSWTSIYSDEDDLIAGAKKNYSPDMTRLPEGGLRLRAERKDGGDGRVYLVVVQTQDGSGNYGLYCHTVVVPLRNSGSALTVVNWQASQALTYAQQNNGAAPPGFFTVGDGPVIGPRQ